MIPNPKDCLKYWFEHQLTNLPKICLPRGETVEHTISESLRSKCKFRNCPIGEILLENDIKLSVLTGEIDMEKYLDLPTIVVQPRGKQQWPDMYILYGYRGIAIEFKTSNQEKITWNSGLPRPLGIYILNGSSSTSDKHTTYCMGSDLISQRTKDLFINYRTKLQMISEKCNMEILEVEPSGYWSLYPRPMYDSNEKILSSKDIFSRELKVIKYLDEFDWEAKRS